MSPTFQTVVLMNEFLSIRQLLIVVLILIVREHRKIPHAINNHIHERGSSNGEEEGEDNIACCPDMRGIEPTTGLWGREHVGGGTTETAGSEAKKARHFFFFFLMIC